MVWDQHKFADYKYKFFSFELVLVVKPHDGGAFSFQILRKDT